MFSRVLGIIWIILGILWLIKPEMLRKRLIRKTSRKIRWAIYGFVLMFIFSLLGIIFRAEGLLLKLIGIIGIFVVIRMTAFVSGRADQKLGDWGSKQSLLFFRIWGIVILIIGLSLFLAR